MTDFEVLCRIEAGEGFDWDVITGTQMHRLVYDALVRYEGSRVVLTTLGARSLQRRRENRDAAKLNKGNDE